MPYAHWCQVTREDDMSRPPACFENSRQPLQLSEKPYAVRKIVIQNLITALYLVLIAYYRSCLNIRKSSKIFFIYRLRCSNIFMAWTFSWSFLFFVSDFWFGLTMFLLVLSLGIYGYMKIKKSKSTTIVSPSEPRYSADVEVNKSKGVAIISENNPVFDILNAAFFMLTQNEISCSF